MNRKHEPRKPETNSSEKLRRCLVCGEEFLSLWAGNRICKRCKASSNWRSGA